MIRGFFKTVLPIAFAVACILAGLGLTDLATRDPVKPPSRRLPLVRVHVAEPGPLRFDVIAHGVVHPSTETTLVARVSGNVESVSEHFREGGFFSAGDVLVRIDRRDFELRKIEAEAVVAEAQAVHDRIEAESQVAREEWKSFGKGDPHPLAVHEPQLAEAKAKLDAAKARLASAELDLERTEIRAPYDGRVRKTSVDFGQFVATGTPIGIVFGTTSAEIRLPIADDQVAFLDLPMAGAEIEGPDVTITAEFAGRSHTWSGRIVRTEGEVDPRTRVLYAVVRVDDPLGRESGTKKPLLPGMFVTATVRGRTVDGVTELPEEAVRAGDRVLLVGEEDTIAYRGVEVLRSAGTGRVAVVGLGRGDRVCLTDVRPVVEGMAVRVADPEAAE